MSIIMDQTSKQLEEVRLLQKLKYTKKKEQEQLEKNKLERLENERLEKIKAEEKMLKEHQEYLDKRSKENNKNSYSCPESETEIPMNHLDCLNDSLVIIISIFEEQSYDFVQNTIITPFYHQINKSSFGDLYTFYISIKDFSCTYENIDIEIIFNTLNLIKMNHRFVEILDKSNKLEYIKIIFQEFVKIIDYLKPDFNNSTTN